jgi:hypothetical protein
VNENTAFKTRLRALIGAFNSASNVLKNGLLRRVYSNLALAGTANVPVPVTISRAPFSNTWAPYDHWTGAVASAAGRTYGAYTPWRSPLPAARFSWFDQALVERFGGITATAAQLRTQVPVRTTVAISTSAGGGAVETGVLARNAVPDVYAQVQKTQPAITSTSNWYSTQVRR